MKATFLLVLLLGISGLAQAEEQQNISQQQLSKRPYTKAPVVDKNTIYEDDVVNQETNAKAEKNYKTLQLHMLGRRPYAVKTTN